MWFIANGLAYNLSKMRRISFSAPCKQSNQLLSGELSGNHGDCEDKTRGSEAAIAVCKAVNDIASKLLTSVIDGNHYSVSKEMEERGFYQEFYNYAKVLTALHLFAHDVVSKEQLHLEMESNIAKIVTTSKHAVLEREYNK